MLLPLDCVFVQLAKPVVPAVEGPLLIQNVPKDSKNLTRENFKLTKLFLT